jgi:hypothetical protein
LLLPTPTNCKWQCFYNVTLSTFTCCFSLLQLPVPSNYKNTLSPSTCSFSLLEILFAGNAGTMIHSLYLHLLLLPPPTTCCWQCFYNDTLSLPPPVASPSFNYLLLAMLLGEYTLYLHLLLLLLQLPVAGNAVRRIHSLPTPVASPSYNYLLLSMLLGEYTLYLHLLLPSPSTNCCCQCC